MHDPWQNLTVSASEAAGQFQAARGDDHGVETYRDFDLWMGLRGVAIVEIGGRELDLVAGMILLVVPGIPVRLRTDDRKPIAMAWAHFDCYQKGKRVVDARKYVDTQRLTLSLPGMVTISLVGHLPTLPLAQTFLTNRSRIGDDVTRLKLNVQLLEVIRHLRLTHVRPEDAQRPQTSPLEHALSYMQRHLDEPMTLEQIGEHTGVSTATLGRIFRQHLHTSPGRHLMQMRMARARDLLRCRDFQIGEVAQACGFRSLSFFSRIFRQEHSASPRQFRESDSVLP